MILLSFDIEEFDVPLEYGASLPFETQMSVSVLGTRRILECLACEGVTATFFCTVNFAKHAPELIREIAAQGHEIASHGYYHSSFEVADLKRSREALEQLTGCRVEGFRMARMMPVDEREVAQAGYRYNSSLNPTFLPGRYNHLDQPRTCFYKEDVLQIPASVTPWLRIPLFWLAYHHLPGAVYRYLVRRTLRHDGYVTTYFHPWEFALPLGEHKEWRLPYAITRHSGDGMMHRLETLIASLKTCGVPFGTYAQFLKQIGSDDTIHR